jgi:cardiolipin synthase C
VNFHDLDLIVTGPVVQQLSDDFDRYWNSSVVWPIETLSPDSVNAQALTRLRIQSNDQARQDRDNPWVLALANDSLLQRLQQGQLPMQWSSQWQVLSDDPDKALKERSPLARSNVLRGLSEAIAGAQSSIVLISPYFVPGKEGTELLIKEARHGLEVEILTNSLAANDVAAVHSGYAKYRKTLVAGGVSLWELKPQSSRAKSMSLFGSSGASLHSKAGADRWAHRFRGLLQPRSALGVAQLRAGHPRH